MVTQAILVWFCLFVVADTAHDIADQILLVFNKKVSSIQQGFSLITYMYPYPASLWC